MKWKPSKSAKSAFDYDSAGGNYIPTLAQYEKAFEFLRTKNLTVVQKSACQMILSAYILQEKIHHDQIHIVNELIREK